MALDSFANLKVAVQSWMFSQASLATNAEDFIKLAEVRFNNGADGIFPTEPLRSHEMEAEATVTLTAGAGALPTDFLEVIDIVANTSPTTQLEYAAPGWLSENYPDTTATDPFAYTIRGSSIVVRPVTTSTLTLLYYQAISALASTNTSNWLLVKAPNVYLWGSVLEAALFNGDTTRIQEAGSALASFMGPLNRSDVFARAGTFHMRAGTPTP